MYTGCALKGVEITAKLPAKRSFMDVLDKVLISPAAKSMLESDSSTFNKAGKIGNGPSDEDRMQNILLGVWAGHLTISHVRLRRIF